MGDTHSGKSLAIERLAKHFYEKTGKSTRVYIGDGGGETYNTEGLVDDGIIELFDYSVLSFPQTVLKLMTKYWWPKDWRDPASKLVAPSADLFDKYAMMVFEGGTVIGNWLLSDTPGGFAWHAAHSTGFGGVKDDEDLLNYTDSFKEVEGSIADEQMQGVNAPKHYQYVQKQILNAIRKSKMFPGLVMWTFHPTEGPDKSAGAESGRFGEIKGKKVIGPDAGGRALASTLPKEFGHFLHADQVSILKEVKDETSHQLVKSITKEFRLYTRRHFDPEKVVLTEYIAGTRSPSVKDYYVSKTPGDSLLQFYQAVADGRAQAKQTRSNA